MFASEDLSSVYGFLKHTGEGNLRKMLVSGKMTDTHLRVLLKITRSVNEQQFIEHFQNETFPKVSLSAAESAVRETFWQVCSQALTGVGLISAQKAA